MSWRVLLPVVVALAIVLAAFAIFAGDRSSESACLDPETGEVVEEGTLGSRGGTPNLGGLVVREGDCIRPGGSFSPVTRLNFRRGHRAPFNDQWESGGTSPRVRGS